MEDEAINFAKFLRKHLHAIDAREKAAFVDDALNLCETIAALAALGRRSSAEHADRILDRVEGMQLLLEDKIGRLFAETE